MTYRQDAIDALERAKIELASSEYHRLKYGVLELRFAIEMLSYDKLSWLSEKTDISEFKSWQPDKVVRLVDQFLPTSSINGTLTIHDSDKKEIFSGKTRALQLIDIKKNYHALGSFLHSLTIEKRETPDDEISSKINQKCKEIIPTIESILSCQVYGLRFGSDVEFDCHNLRCKKKIFTQIAPGNEATHIECLHCQTEYKLTPDGKHVNIDPKLFMRDCGAGECKGLLKFFTMDVGEKAVCSDCESEAIIIKTQLNTDFIDEKIIEKPEKNETILTVYLK